MHGGLGLGAKIPLAGPVGLLEQDWWLRRSFVSGPAGSLKKWGVGEGCGSPVEL